MNSLKTSSLAESGLALAIFVLGLSLPFQALEAQESSPSTSQLATTPPTSADDLSPEVKREAEDLYKKAVKQFSKDEFDACMATIQKLYAIVPPNPSVLNLEAAIYTRKKDYAKAREVFKKALEIQPKNLAIRFNIAEIDFLEKKYGEAEQGFKALVEEDGPDGLAQYKVYLTYLLQGKNEQADALLETFDFTSKLPTYYFANAAKEYVNGDKEKAESWIVSARKIYQGNLNGLFAETLVDLGFLTKDQFEKVKLTAREAIIPKDQPLRVPKSIADELNLLGRKQAGNPLQKERKGQTDIPTNPFEAQKGAVPEFAK